MASQSSGIIGSNNAAGECLTPSRYARLLLNDLGFQEVELKVNDDRAASMLWAQSGAMYLSGHADGLPQACPAPLAACAQGAWLALSFLCFNKTDPSFDAFRLLSERAAVAGLVRRGRTSPGGACSILEAADGMLALNLAREDDHDLLPAWLEQSFSDQQELPDILRLRPMATLIERARILGLAAAPVTVPVSCQHWYYSERYASSDLGPRFSPLVIDLSSLWAGPLCGQLLSQCGARVIKVESKARPDGARSGPQDFYSLMNADKESVALDLRNQAGRNQLAALLRKADIVIESARPRALEQMGIIAADIVAENPGMVWLSITGYGRRAPMRDWIAYGDDAGVAAGLSWLVGGEKGDPVFCGDAIADPLTGLHAALLALATWYKGGGQLLDISLRDVVAYCIDSGLGSADDSMEDVDISKPVARTVWTQAAELGADTHRVLRELG